MVETDKTGTSALGKQCKWLQVYRAEKLAQENCVGPTADIQGGEELGVLFKDASRFYQDVIGQLNSSGVLPIPENMFPEMVPSGGLPMISRLFKDGKLTKFQKDFVSCWWHSGANIVDGSPFISRDDVVKFYVEARGIGLKSARQYAKSSNSSAMVGYLFSVEVIAVSGNGWVMMDNVSKSLMLLRKNEPGNEGNRS